MSYKYYTSNYRRITRKESIEPQIVRKRKIRKTRRKNTLVEIMTTKSIVLDVQMMLEVLAPLPAIAARKIMSACSTKKSTYP